MIYQLSQHARDQMQERAISAEVLDAVLQHPEQIVPGTKGRRVYQSLADIDGRTFLVRVVATWQAPETEG